MTALELPTIAVPHEGAAFLRALEAGVPADEYHRLGCRPILGGADIFPVEGLDRVIGVMVRNLGDSSNNTNAGAILTTHYLGLFTSPAIGTLPDRAATLTGGTGGVPSGTNAITEVTGGSYARAAITSSDWPAQQNDTNNTGTSGRESRVSGSGVSFPTSTAAWGNVQGFVLATKSTSGGTQNNGLAIFYANFDDGQAINVNASGYTVRVAPWIRFDH